MIVGRAALDVDDKRLNSLHFGRGFPGGKMVSGGTAGGRVTLHNFPATA